MFFEMVAFMCFPDPGPGSGDFQAAPRAPGPFPLAITGFSDSGAGAGPRAPIRIEFPYFSDSIRRLVGLGE